MNPELFGYNPEQSDMATKQPTTTKNPAAQALGRLGGRAGTKAQNKARKQNAQHGGRPGRVCVRCSKPVVGGHVDRRLDDTCGQHGWRWQRKTDDDALTLEAIEREIDSHQQAIADLQKQLRKL